MTRIFYICDQKACEEVGMKCHWPDCKHTTDVEHALYGECKDPKEHLDRFKITAARDKEGTIVDYEFWERLERKDTYEDTEDKV